MRNRESRSNDLNVALIGAGQQGNALLENSRTLPGIHIQAICDIWDYRRDSSCRLMRSHGHHTTGYEDYRDMLTTEHDLDAVLIATPDFIHAEQTNACLTAGLHVYCEPEMARTIAEAQSMVRTARTTGKLLQIGRQRRSNARYRHAIDKLIREANLLGRLTHGKAHWHQPVEPDRIWPLNRAIPQSTLDRYGYTSMHEFMNWPWFHQYSIGLTGMLSSHQIDVFRWAFGVNSSAIVAAGGVDYYKNRQTFDNLNCILDFPTTAGMVRASCQMLATTSQSGYFESLMGIDGYMEFSDLRHTIKFTPRLGVWSAHDAPDCTPPDVMKNDFVCIECCPTCRCPITYEYRPPSGLQTSSQQSHLKNFFDAIRGKEKLNCPAEDAFATAVTMFKIREAVTAGRRLFFRPEEFTVV